MFEHVPSVVGPYVKRPAECREHDPRAATVAKRVAALVTAEMPGLRVEHVGSSAVPGCAGKGNVDLMIAVQPTELEPLRELLLRLGFQRQTIPEAFPDSRPLLQGTLEEAGETFLLHVHVIPADSAEVDALRFFRDCLRADPQLRKAYVGRKREIIASGVTDSLAYAKQKGAFIKETLG